MKRTFAGISAVFALAIAAAPLTIITAAPAGAAKKPIQICRKLVGHANFKPGLTNVPTDNVIKAKGKQTKCTGRKGAPKTGGSGVMSATIKVKQGSCLKLANGNQVIKGKAKTAWKNKKVSKYALTLTTGTGANATTAAIKGKVTGGLFKGHKVTGAVKFTVKGTPDCTTKPVSAVTFKNSKAFKIV
jgi:hypothetical protein